MKIKSNSFNMKVRYLIQCRRQQLQVDREALKKSKLLTEYQEEQIKEELEDLRVFELELGGRIK
ncbi:hypothetical protein [Enterococcus sp. AZ103]|uniref:hypothetical protein n=1 Tax=Enterococcus sp. AZ103 TaxID=2774628 RepID=UPI003F223D07